MKSNPLVMAMRNHMPMTGVPRHLELRHSEIPGLPNLRIGDSITVKLNGKIHSQHADGHTILEISDVQEDGTPQETSKIVTTQQSNIPS